MSEQTKGLYDEPWSYQQDGMYSIQTRQGISLGSMLWGCDAARAIACVNACDGMTSDQIASGVVSLAEVETAVQAAMSDLFTLGWDVLDRDVIAGAMGAVLEHLREGR